MDAVLWALLFALSLVWGGSFLFNAIALEQLPTLTIVALRLVIAAGLLWGIVVVVRLRLPAGWRIWLSFAIMGLVNNAIPFVLIVWGQRSIASGLASILNATAPLFTVIVAGIFLADERFTIRKLAGVAIGIAGVAMIVGPDALAGASGDVTAQLAVLGAAFSYAVAGVYGRRFGRLGIDPILAATGQVTAGGLLLAPVAVFVERPWQGPVPTYPVWLAIAGLAALSTAFAYLLYFHILQRAGATNLLLVTFLVPVSAILLGAMFLGERLDAMHFLGMATIAIGLAAVDGRLLARRKVPCRRGV